MTVITGDANPNTLNGGADDDTLRGLAGNDTLNGGAGNDVLEGGDGVDNLYGQDGDDRLEGGTSNDHLFGGAGSDTAVFAGASSGFIIYRDNAAFITVRDVGNQTATGLGRDYLYNDVEYISFNDLTLSVASLNLQLNGEGWGTALWSGTTGADNIGGTQAADVMYGGDGADLLNGPSGSAGNDTLYGQGGNDNLYGGAGNDVLDGGAGVDALYAGDGNDIMTGGADSDAFYGGAGVDTATYTQNSSGFIIYRDNAGYITVRDMADTTTAGAGTDRYYNDETEFLQFGDTTIDLLALNLQVNGAGWGSATFTGTAGNDGINGTLAADVMFGGDGNDQLNGSAGSAGNDTLYGEGGNDVLNGGAGDDSLFGGDGADTLNGGDGNDVLSGGDGVDMLTFGTATAAVTVNLGVTVAQNTGGAGSDTISGIENVTGSNYNDSLTGDGAANRLLGGSGDDVLDGAAGNDTLEGGVGNDTLLGGDGDDTLNGGVGNDLIDGGAGTNTISFSGLTGGVGVGLDLRNTAAQNTTGAGIETVSNVQNIVGSSYADVFIGTDGANRINGAVGSDVIYGEGGDDTLEGGSGNDTLYGGAGDDFLDGGFNDDYIDGEGGSNYASYASASAAVTVNLSIVGAQNTGTAGGTDTLVNIQNLRGSNFNDTLIGNDGDNAFIGGLGDDTINGGAGLDTISYIESTSGVTVNMLTGTSSVAAEGTDTLISIEGITGSRFDDTLIGDAADNILEGGLGNDTLDGGDGNDTASYIYSTENLTVNLSLTTAQNFGALGTDTLIDIENVKTGSGNDTILGSDGNNVLDGGSGINTVSYANAANGVVVNLSIAGAQNTIGAGVDTLVGFTNLTGSAEDDILSGNAGNNTINGGGGADTAMLTGRWIDYTITYAGGVYTLVDRRGIEGTDTYINIESFDFADQTIDPVVPADMLNDAPTDITVMPSTVLATAPDDYPVATLAAIDPDNGDTAAFTITGGANAASFYIVGGELRLAAGGLSGHAPGDFLEVFLTVTDAGGLSVQKIVQIEVVANLLTGTNGNDNLIGTAAADEINALAGNDIVQGRGGNDIMDGGLGTDTLSYVQATGGVRVNLSITTAQDTGADGVDTVTNFENITGSAFGDTLTGDNAINVITGGDGDDTIAGLGGNDTLNGGNGIDTIDYSAAVSAVTFSLRSTAAQVTGGAGTDTVSNFENIIGSTFNDIFTQSNLANVIDGGAGFDRVSYAGMATAVVVNLGLAGAQNTGGGGTDTLLNIEALTGSSYNDTLTGNAADNLLQGANGNDIIDGGAGNDTLDGGSGTDTVSYATAAAGVTVNLALTTAQNTIGAGSDIITTFENLTGSAFNDTLIGNAGTNILRGGDGNDLFDGGVGSDSFYGDAGIDTVTYETATARITVSLMLTARQNTTSSGTELLAGIENLIGSAFNDTLEGSAGDNVINAGLGVDTLSFSRHTAAVTASLAITTAQNTGAGGTDTYTGFENIVGSNYNDIFTGDGADNNINGGSGNDTIEGGGGNDILTGGNGTDTVTYANASAGVTVNLTTTTAQNTVGAGTDTLATFENLHGSAFNDTLTGNTANNTLWGGAGNDRLDGGAGNDFLYGGFGADYLDGNSGTDWARYDDDTAGVNVNLTTGVGTGGQAQGDTLVGIEYVMGGSGNDVLIGNTASNRLEGGAGSDLLNGGAGTDVLYGGLDNDILNGGTSNDTLNGGAGADVFEFSPGGGVDLIQDFVVGDYGLGLGDALDIADILTGFNPATSNINDFVRFTNSGGNTLVSIDANGATGGASFTQIATLQGVTGLSVSSLYADDQIIVL